MTTHTQDVALSKIQLLIAELGALPCPPSKDIKDLAYAIHGAMVRADVPEMLWLSTSFEDMGDIMVRAIECASADVDSVPDNTWVLIQDQALRETV